MDSIFETEPSGVAQAVREPRAGRAAHGGVDPREDAGRGRSVCTDRSHRAGACGLSARRRCITRCRSATSSIRVRSRSSKTSADFQRTPPNTSAEPVCARSGDNRLCASVHMTGSSYSPERASPQRAASQPFADRADSGTVIAWRKSPRPRPGRRTRNSCGVSTPCAVAMRRMRQPNAAHTGTGRHRTADGRSLLSLHAERRRSARARRLAPSSSHARRALPVALCEL